MKITQGNKVAKIDFGKFSVDELIAVLQKRKNRILSVAAKNTYRVLQNVCESEDKKKIIFEFSNNASFYFNLPNHKFYHSKDNKPITQNNPASILNTNGKKDILILDSGNSNRYFVAAFCKSEWVKTFLAILSVSYYSLNNWIEGSSTNNFKKIILFYEQISKQEYIQKLLCDPNNHMRIDDFYNIICDNGPEEIKKFNEKNEWFLRSGLCNGMDNRDMEEQYASFRRAYHLNLKDAFIHTFDNYNISLTANILNNIKELTNFGYEQKRLIDYIFRDLRGQGINIGVYADSGEDYDMNDVDNSIIQMLLDYARMNEEMKREYEKYPRYLKSFHDITVQNYNLFIRKTENKRFQKVIKNFAKYEYENETYCVIAPSAANDLITEGSRLNHCVASYIDDVIAQKTCIMFLRKILQKDTPLVTLEIKKDRVVQAKGKNNSNPASEESKFLAEYKDYLKKI